MTEGVSLLPPCLRKTPEIVSLPVVDVLDELDKALETEKRALVQAPPGAGKTTLVPLALKDRPWLKNKKIIMLEPRRLAARACAAHMANLLGEKPGQTVGFQVRMDRCIGPGTRIEIITEGILTRRIQSDPGLEETGLLIFDEFHERHIHGDLGLALALESAEVLNPGLRILVMSATMDTQGLSAIMGNAPMISSQGKTWPVDTHYLDTGGEQAGRFPGRPGDKAAQILGPCFRAVVRALEKDEGDILVFLPGAAQIRKLAEQLGNRFKDEAEVRIHPLFGNLSHEAQAAAIAPSRSGQRKIVLATPIAETSLTIQGVRVVVDSGLANAPRFSPGRGMTRLSTLAVSRASADQRRGRAGRTAPGVCYRLWSEHVHQGLVPFNRPEILNADLSSLTLELANWGVTDPGELNWLDLPPESAFDAAVVLLKQLEALDDYGRITPHGRALLAAGTHPRLAHMVIRANAIGQGFMACCLAALIEERDFVFSDRARPDPDICLRLEILDRMAQGKPQGGRGFHAGRAKAVLARARHLVTRFKVRGRSMEIPEAGRFLAFAWPERVAKKRKSDPLSYLMAQGGGTFFRSENSISGREFMVAVHVDGNPRNAAVFMAAAYDGADLERDFPSQLDIREEVVWDEERRAVKAVTRTRYGKLLLKETPLARPDPGQIRQALIQGIVRAGPESLAWSKTATAFRHRVIFLKTLGKVESALSELPDLSDRALASTLDVWLAPFLDGISSLAGLKQVDLETALKAMFTWDQLKLVDTHAPTHIIVPSGSKIPLRYGDENGPLDHPVLAVRLQEMFGLAATPSIARGKVALTLHLLSPASRPVQITRDLENFWLNTYKEVKKDLMGRYPKHYWPDDPGTASPTARAKPRKR